MRPSCDVGAAAAKRRFVTSEAGMKMKRRGRIWQSFSLFLPPLPRSLQKWTRRKRKTKKKMMMMKKER